MSIALALLLQVGPDLKPVEFLVGEWEAGADAVKSGGYGTLSCRPALGGAYLELHEVWKLGDLVMEESWSLVTWDRGREHIVMTRFDRDGSARYLVASPLGENRWQWNEPLRDAGRRQLLLTKVGDAEFQVTLRRENEFGDFDPGPAATYRKKK
jgi:hypothetical protein